LSPDGGADPPKGQSESPYISRLRADTNPGVSFDKEITKATPLPRITVREIFT